MKRVHHTGLILLFLLISMFAWAGPKDSLRLEIRNGKKYIKHRVESKETLGVLAARYGVEELSIRDANPLITDAVYRGQVVYIPIQFERYGDPEVLPVLPQFSAGLTASTNTTNTSNKPEVTVSEPPAAPLPVESTPAVVETKKEAIPQSVETPTNSSSVNKLAETKPEIKSAPIVEVKKESSNEPVPVPSLSPVNTSIQTPTGSNSSLDVKPSNANKNVLSHRVKKGETIMSIAEKYQVMPDELFTLNDIQGNYIKPGTIIRIPDHRLITTENPVIVAQTPTQTPVEVAPVVVKKEKPIVSNEPIVIHNTAPEIQDQNVLIEEKKAVYDGRNTKEVTRDTGQVSAGSAIQATYKVRKGETAVIIAEKFSIEPAELMDLNNLQQNYIRPGTIIHLYSGKTGTQQEAADRHTKLVVKNDVMKFKSGKEQITTGAYIGQNMASPDGSGTIEPISEEKLEEIHRTFEYTSAIKEPEGFHNVREGETLTSIAAMHAISTADIVNWNNLIYRNIHPGQDLIISAKVAAKPHHAMNALTDADKAITRQNANTARIEDHNERGLCEYNDNPAFVGILHATAPIGTTVLLENKENFKRKFGVVTGRLLNSSNANVVLLVDRRTARDLQINSKYTNISIRYELVQE